MFLVGREDNAEEIADHVNCCPDMPVRGWQNSTSIAELLRTSVGVTYEVNCLRDRLFVPSHIKLETQEHRLALHLATIGLSRPHAETCSGGSCSVWDS